MMSINAIIFSAVFAANDPLPVEWPIRQDAMIEFKEINESSNRRKRRKSIGKNSKKPDDALLCLF